MNLYYNGSGKIKYECNWAHNKKEGKQIWYYNESGKLRNECTWVNGKKEGKQM